MREEAGWVSLGVIDEVRPWRELFWKKWLADSVRCDGGVCGVVVLVDIISSMSFLGV